MPVAIVRRRSWNRQGSVGPASGAEGATLRGTLTYGGPLPEMKPLEVDHDRECCAQKPIYPELLLVSEAGGNLGVYGTIVEPGEIRVGDAVERIEVGG